MKITKLGHSCLLVEMPAPVSRTVLFDPGIWSSVDIDSLEFLDDIIVTHDHKDHMDIELLRKLQDKFPELRLRSTDSAASLLADAGLNVTQGLENGIEIFEAPHEPIEPLGPTPDNIGVHYLNTLTHPGDSLNFAETKDILALPVTAPWGATTLAVNKALNLKPKFVLPIHDWHWSDEARTKMYDTLQEIFAAEEIEFIKLEYGKAVVLDQ